MPPVPQTLQIRPYARLLAMLGEQLIKNERIALIEIIKNSYDADASWATIRFENVGPNYSITEESTIIIEDDGTGMTRDVLANHWLNPATPEKKLRKQAHPQTAKGRFLQGEKGIGRFAVLKLGRDVRVVTRPVNSDREYILTYDFNGYDDEFLTKDGNTSPPFLDELPVSITARKPKLIVESRIRIGRSARRRVPHGTRIEISNLKGTWNKRKVKAVYNDLARLNSLFEEVSKKNAFDVWIYKNGELDALDEEYSALLNDILENHSVLTIDNGMFDNVRNEFRFDLTSLTSSESITLPLDSPDVRGLSVFKRNFEPTSQDDSGDASIENRLASISCGPFSFGFFVFDFSSNAHGVYELDKEQKQVLRQHRVYLYRDGVRVMPYGEPEDDWLRIDAYRGTLSAGHFLSNDQVVGYVNISHADNPRLRDKTNREGLIDDGDATQDFVGLLQVLLAWIRTKPYARYRGQVKRRKEEEERKKHQVDKRLSAVRDAVAKVDKKAAKEIDLALSEYKAEKQFLTRRAELTEELAGVGLSVETASHDIVAIMKRSIDFIDSMIRSCSNASELSADGLRTEFETLRGMLGFVEAQLRDIQLLFRSSKRRRSAVRVSSAVEKVSRIYQSACKKAKVEVQVISSGSPLVAFTSDAVLLQLLLNLFDNAIYWLDTVNLADRRIEILLDGDYQQMIFSDNGPGIPPDDAPYIFEPFYSGKGEDGRGLGLYIAKQLLERHRYVIRLAASSDERRLPGANFVVEFVTDGE